MASGPLLGGSGGGGGGGDGQREKNRWSESKVYTRKSHKSSKPNPSATAAANPPPTNASNAAQQPLPPPPPAQDDANSTYHQLPPQQVDPAASLSDDEASSLNHKNYTNNDNQHRKLSSGQRRSVTINLASLSPQEVRELRRRLIAELEQVRALSRIIESREAQAVAASAPPHPLSQLSANDPQTPTPARRTHHEAASVAPFRRHLSISVPGGPASEMEALEKEKRTPKVNQLYSNSEFILAKDKLPPAESNKKSKSNGGKKHELDHVGVPSQKLYSHAFKSCTTLLQRLMKHKFSWVFNSPVDVKGLGLRDYFTIIRHPMDLGTVKSRLANKYYKHPREFADDVRLTFRNAMTYNPKGQDVHIMAEELLGIFDLKWPAIEAESSVSRHSLPQKVHAPQLPPPIDVRALERSDSTIHLVAESKKHVQTPQSGRVPALKKPKAKDPHKRDMTFEEKQKLSNNLQNLPPEKLDNIVQIIKKRNSSLSQHDDEIEVDIDSVDVETLWELDRFVTNYKKSLSKNKRKIEIASQRRAEQEQNAQARGQEMNMEPVVAEVEKGSQTDGKYVGTSAVGGEKRDNATASSSSSTSSSGSGSSSSDSESESSSGYESDAHSPRT